MINYFRNFLILMYLSLFAAHASMINDRNNTNSNINNKSIVLLKEYLREITSVAIDFTQKDSAGNYAIGKLLISKPSKFRCNYYAPFPLLIVGNAEYVAIYDYDMQHVSRIKSEENFFNFLLEDVIYFDKYFCIESIIEESNLFKVILYHILSEKTSRITFNKSSKEIQKLEIFEDNNTIIISFDNIVKIRKFDSDLFKIRNPEIFGKPIRLEKQHIEKKYKTILNACLDNLKRLFCIC